MIIKIRLLKFCLITTILLFYSNYLSTRIYFPENRGKKLKQQIFEKEMKILKNSVSQTEMIKYLIEAKEWDELEKIGKPVIEYLIPIIDQVDNESKVNIISIFGKLKAEEARELLLKYARDKDWNVSYEALSALAGYRDNTVTLGLMNCLDDSTFTSAEYAINAMQKIGNPSVIPTIIRYYARQLDSKQVVSLDYPRIDVRIRNSLDYIEQELHNPSESVRLIAIRFYNAINFKKSVSVLKNVVETDSSQKVIHLAAESIAQLNSDNSKKILLYFLNNPNKVIRKAALEAMSKYETITIKDRIYLCLQDQDADVRISAIKCLSSLTDSITVKHLTTCLQDKNIEVRSASILALINCNEYQDVQSLQNLINNPDNNYQSYQKLTDALAQISNEASFAALADYLKSNNKDLKFAAITSLNELYKADSSLKNEQCTRIVINNLLNDCLNDSQYCNRFLAVETLGNIGDTLAVDPLINLLTGEISYETGHIVIVLSKIASKRASKPIIAFLQTPANPYKVDAIKALTRIEDPIAIVPIISCLSDSVDEVVESAIEALGNFKAKEAISCLIPFLDSDNKEFVYSAIEALDNIGEIEAVNPLLSLLSKEKKDNIVVYDIVQALLNMNDKIPLKMFTDYLDNTNNSNRDVIPSLIRKINENAEILIPYLKDENPNVVISTVYDLGKIGDKKAVPHIVPLLPCWDMNDRICEALDRLGWKPVSSQEQVYYWIGTKDKVKLKDNWDQVKSVLMEDLQAEPQKRENAAFALICLGKTEYVEQLIELFNNKPSITLARGYSQCFNESLETAVEAYLESTTVESILDYNKLVKEDIFRFRKPEWESLKGQ